jgi:hypothetical protein
MGGGGRKRGGMEREREIEEGGRERGLTTWVLCNGETFLEVPESTHYEDFDPLAVSEHNITPTCICT